MLTFAAGFGANYAIALAPAQASVGALYTLNDPTNFTYGSDGTNGNAQSESHWHEWAHQGCQR